MSSWIPSEDGDVWVPASAITALVAAEHQYGETGGPCVLLETITDRKIIISTLATSFDDAKQIAAQFVGMLLGAEQTEDQVVKIENPQTKGPSCSSGACSHG